MVRACFVNLCQLTRSGKLGSMNLSVVKNISKKTAIYRFIRLRHRYFFTRDNRLRLRYMAGGAVVMSMVMASLLGAMSSSIAFSPISIGNISSIEVFGDHAEEDGVMVLASLNDVDVNVSQIPLDEEERADNIDSALAPMVEIDDAKKTGPYEEILKIGAGDTISGALKSAGVSGAEAYRVVKAMSSHYDPRLIKPGQAIAIKMEPSDEGMELTSMNMKMNSIKELSISRDEHGRFKPELIEKEVVLKVKASKAVINSSLYASAARAGIPASVIAEMIRVYSYEVDFQRDIRQGDTIEILYETYETEEGDFARYGHVLYANLKVHGEIIPIYRFEDKDGDVDYFHEDGTNLKQILMKTPVDGARMSSGYGMRRHPILGYNKMHKGMDFAASRGTPIYAAGDGVLEKAGRNGSFGNYIRIRHNNSLKTAYAHMKKLAKGMKKGKRVKQGQVIGYVGTTGRSTGPHLHYEVHKNGKNVNPKSIKSANREKLKGKQRELFNGQVIKIKQQYASLARDLKFAQNKSSE